MSKVQSSIRALGEIALHVEDLDKMQDFYKDVIGLPLMKRFANSAFFKIADGFEGHTQILALFDRTDSPTYTGLDVEKTTLDHIAFAISLDDFEPERRRLEQRGLQVDTAEHGWVHWRSLYVHDPEGNYVEFVCYDDNVR